MNDERQSTDASAEPDQPGLVIVAGRQASGKSTLAERIAAGLGWPLFTKDRFKEGLFDAGGFDPDRFGREESTGLGAQAVATLLDVATTLIEARVSVVIESNFRPHLAGSDLAPLVARSRARQVHCAIEGERVIERYRSRTGRDERHPVHVDADKLGDLEAQIEAGYGAPLPLDAPLLSVSTDDGYDPPFEEIVAFCRTTSSSS